MDHSGDLWVSSYRENEITEYAPDVKGNVAPINEIRGSSTQLNGPCGMATDANGDLFVANVYGNSITVYAKGARGNTTPKGVIEGGNTNLSWPFAIAFDPSGRLLVAEENPDVLVFASGAMGNVAPVQNITSIKAAGGVMSDSAGHIYIADTTGNSIKEFAGDANGDAMPLRTISGPKTGLKTPYYLGLQ
ncbi:MAG TPA: hypothetical protein VMT95_08970 [Candidatus Binatia bacterium]|nr:hypothetical protein [Candidatus Binatia bacterium]